MLHVPSVLSNASNLSDSTRTTASNSSPPNHEPADPAAAAAARAAAPGGQEFDHNNNNNNNNSALNTATPDSRSSADISGTNSPVVDGGKTRKYHTNTSNNDDDDDAAAIATRNQNQVGAAFSVAVNRSGPSVAAAASATFSMHDSDADDEDLDGKRSAEAAGFDVLDEMPKSIHAHCVGTNRDGSRVYCGHDYGLTVWTLPSPLTSSSTTDAASIASAVSMNINNNPRRSGSSQSSRCYTVTLSRMFGKQWTALGGKGIVFCAAILQRTDYAVCGVRSTVDASSAGGSSSSGGGGGRPPPMPSVEKEELFVLQGREVRHRLFSRLQLNVADLIRDEEKILQQQQQQQQQQQTTSSGVAFPVPPTSSSLSTVPSSPQTAGVSPTTVFASTPSSPSPAVAVEGSPPASSHQLPPPQLPPNTTNPQQHQKRKLALLKGPLLIREVCIEQDRIFVLCNNSFHVFDLGGRALFCSVSEAAAPPTQTSLFREAINAVTSTVGAIGGWLLGSLAAATSSSSSTQQQQSNTSANRSPTIAASSAAAARFTHPMQCSVLCVVKPPLSSGDDEDGGGGGGAGGGGSVSSSLAAAAASSSAFGGVSGGSSVYNISAAAVPGSTPGTFSVIEWSSTRPGGCVPISTDIPAHTGHLAALAIVPASTAGSVRLIGVTASTTGTTCRVFDAILGTKLRTFRMTNPSSDGSCLPTFRLRGIEVDAFGRVVVLCQDSAAVTPAPLVTTSSSFASSDVTAPSATSAGVVKSGSGTPATAALPSSLSAASASSPSPPPSASSASSNHKPGSLEALFFDADVGSEDGLAPIAGEHLIKNESFTSRAVTVGVTIAAGKRVAAAADALRPMARIVLPLRAVGATDQSSGLSGGSNNNNNQSSGGAAEKSITDELCTIRTLNTNTINDGSNGISAAAGAASGGSSAGQSPDAMSVAVVRIHSSGIRSVAQLTFGALPRTVAVASSDLLSPTSSATATVPSADNNNNNNNNNNSRKLVMRMGAEMRQARDAAGSVKIDIVRQF